MPHQNCRYVPVQERKLPDWDGLVIALAIATAVSLVSGGGVWFFMTNDVSSERPATFGDAVLMLQYWGAVAGFVYAFAVLTWTALQLAYWRDGPRKQSEHSH